QVSKAVAWPVVLGLISEVNGTVTSAGRVIVGAVVSRRVMVCTASALLPQASVAVQLRVMTLAPPQVLATTSLKVTTTELQPSWAVAVPVLLGLVSAGHSKVTLGGAVIAGGVVSRRRMFCTALAALPQASVAVQVRTILLVPAHPAVTASLKETL